MNCRELYQNIKKAMGYFGLPWSEQESLQVSFKDDCIVFSVGNESISFRAEEDKMPRNENEG